MHKQHYRSKPKRANHPFSPSSLVSLSVLPTSHHQLELLINIVWLDLRLVCELMHWAQRVSDRVRRHSKLSSFAAGILYRILIDAIHSFNRVLRANAFVTETLRQAAASIWLALIAPFLYYVNSLLCCLSLSTTPSRWYRPAWAKNLQRLRSKRTRMLHIPRSSVTIFVRSYHSAKGS